MQSVSFKVAPTFIGGMASLKELNTKLKTFKAQNDKQQEINQCKQ